MLHLLTAKRMSKKGQVGVVTHRDLKSVILPFYILVLFNQLDLSRPELNPTCKPQLLS